MGHLFLAARSSLGTVVLVLPSDGPAYPLPAVWVCRDGLEEPFRWGMRCNGCLHLADALAAAVRGPEAPPLDLQRSVFYARLQEVRHDVWILTEREVLCDLALIA